jgi:hypothetical protein
MDSSAMAGLMFLNVRAQQRVSHAQAKRSESAATEGINYKGFAIKYRKREDFCH